MLVADVDAALPGWAAAGYAVAERWGPPFAILEAEGMPDLWLSGPGTSAARTVEGSRPATPRARACARCSRSTTSSRRWRC